MNNEDPKSKATSTDDSETAPQRRLTVEVPTEVQAGLIAICTCPPGCCGPGCATAGW